MEIEIREAVAADKRPLMEFIKDVWEGHDYIPGVWDDWLKDRRAKMYVIVANGRPVGMNRMRYLGDGKAWLEGVRIHPDYRGKGLASMLGRNSIEIGKNEGVSTYRLTSGSWNRAAHRQVAKMGFKEIARVTVYAADRGSRFVEQGAVRQASRRDLPMILERIRGSTEFRLGAGVYWDGFTAISLTDKVIGNLVGSGSIYMAGDSLAVAVLGGEGKDVWKQVGFLTGGEEGAMMLLRHIFGKKERVKTNWRLAYLPQGSHQIGVARRMGLKRRWPLVLFEVKADQ